MVEKIGMASCRLTVLSDRILTMFPNHHSLSMYTTLLLGAFLAIMLIFSTPTHSLSQSLPVTHIPNYGPPRTTQFSGYLELKSQRGRLFHWFFEREGLKGLTEEERKEIPLVLWLNGGPGCSSFTGLLEENGPYRFIGDSFNLKDFEHRWLHDAHMIYIDQPVGTGLSHADRFVRNELEVAEDLHSALVEFLKLHPEYHENPFFITGESYFGKYSSTAKYILDRNHAGDFHINLQGVALGNALMHPIIQRLIKADQIYNHQLVSFEGREMLQDLLLRCAAHVQNQDMYPSDTCELYHHFFTVSSGGINRYDLRRFDDTTNRTRREMYLNMPEVREALHAPFAEQPEFVGCSSKVHDYLEKDVLRSVKYIIPELVKSGIRVLLFAGNMDLKDGPVGMEAVLQSSSFFVKELGFKTWRRDLWINPQRQVAGYVKSKDNFTFLVIHGAGHFVPTDQGSNARDMIRKFILDIPFCSDETVDFRNMREEENPGLRMRLSGFSPRSTTYKCSSIAGHLCRETTKLNGSPCSGHGTCSDTGFCQCQDGWTGTHCGWNHTRIQSDALKSNDGLTFYLFNQHWHFVDSDFGGMVRGKVVVVHHHTDGKPDQPVRALTTAVSGPSPSSSYYSPAYMEEKMVGEGLGTQLPWNKVCIYGKKNAQPSYRSFHFVHCLEDEEIEGTFITPFTDADSQWKFSIWNGLPHPIETQVLFSRDEPTEEPRRRCSLAVRVLCIFFMCTGACS
uniref:EGF-like domain-containing protein n=1 Tax=Percolomonas cosmopolitus TaxID=63605 RepID=A0A7S1PGY2_9EUKA|mmetsp:Transcript_10897/g.40629  ORF Transcript_10897/g.40629 Transcript_10897/m.40629 type:complete len:734 (+) Transcript_10897:154-2355(+)